jgi:hypothetical protein
VGNDFSGGIDYQSSFVTYNPFTGSHYGWADESFDFGDLVRLTGTNRWVKPNANGEIIYGISHSTVPDDPRCLGSYLSHQKASEAGSNTNYHLIMAVGNGVMWVTDGGIGDLDPGNYLISSDVPGCAMKDDPARFPIGYICARAGEGVHWADIQQDAHGVKRKRISVLYESFERHGASPALAATVKAQQERIDALETELKLLRGQCAKLEAVIASRAVAAFAQEGRVK